MAESPAIGPINEAEVVKALTEEYKSAKQEVLLHLQLYKTQERNGAILIGLLGLLIPLLIGQSISIPAMGIKLPSTHWTDIVILFTISTVTFYMFFSGLAILFNLQLLAERCVRLENGINKYLPEPYLVWEGRITQAIWSKESGIVPKMPDWIVVIIFYLLIIVLAFLLPLWVLTKILCEGPDPLLKAAVFFYTWYLFIALPFGMYINNYCYGALRTDCRQLFDQATKGNVPALGRSGRGTLPIIGVAAFAVAGFFITFIPHPTVCTYLRTTSPSSASAPVPSPGQPHASAP